MKRLGVAIAAVGIVGGILSVAPPANAAPAPAQPAASVQWGTCASSSLQKAHAECAMLPVPLDYSHPNGATISLAISRIRHTSPDADYQGIMLANPGGPGGSGLGLARLGARVPNNVGNTYDWIGFDPRGVGSSVPAINCEPDYFQNPRPSYVPTTRDLERTWLTRSKDYATACGAKYGALLSHMTTPDLARDMESIRKALGARQINYYGFSYGTYLGQVYATLFPQRVRRMVLDSNVDPRDVFYQLNLSQDTAFDRNIDIWFGWVAKFDNVFHLGTTEKAVRDLFYAERAALIKNPAGGLVGGDEWTDVFLNAGYSRRTWVQLGNAFAGFVHNGDWQTLNTLYQGNNTASNENTFAVYLSVECTDAQWPTNWNKWRADNTRINAKAPFYTWDNAWFNAPCVFWPAPAHQPVRIDGGRVGGVLLIDETLDGATPFNGSLEVRQRFPHASLIAEPGGASHADSLSGDACVDNQVASYLASGALPARKHGPGPDTTCAPLPDPVPTA